MDALHYSAWRGAHLRKTAAQPSLLQCPLAPIVPPVVAIKSTVALVMENVPPGSTVGYGSTYRTDPDKPSRLFPLMSTCPEFLAAIG